MTEIHVPERHVLTAGETVTGALLDCVDDAILVLGEMVLSPIGLSVVTTLSVPRVVGLMMGAWFLFSAFGEIIAGRLGTWATIEPDAGGNYDVPAALALYTDVFTQMMWIGLAAGALLFVATPLLKRLTRD